MTDERRRTVAVPVHLTAYVHMFLVGPEVVADRLDAGRVFDSSTAAIATCRTALPAARCECGMYDLVWSSERG